MNRWTMQQKKGAQDCDNQWDGAFWVGVPALAIDQFHSRSSDHHPQVQAKLAYDEAGIAVCFRVADQYVVSRHTAFNDMVCLDSCVEFFFRPAGAEGYFNFEVNCGGTLHASYVRNPERKPGGGFIDWTPLSAEDGAKVRILSSLPKTVEPEITDPTVWTLSLFIPFTVLKSYCGAAADSREGWRANLYKCADHSSHPHWGAWNAVEPLNFHQPKLFGELCFGGSA